MDHYLDIRLLPDPEFPLNVLMNALYAKLHRSLVTQGTGEIGVSFPEHGWSGLGARMRLHGRAPALEQLLALNWLTGLRDHCQLSAIQAIPAPVQYRTVRRVQAKSNPERLERRLLKRRIARGQDPDQAQATLPQIAPCPDLKLPYVVLNSHSTGQQFHLFIEHGPLQAQPQSGPFSLYGLSPSSTIPWF